MRLDPGSPKMIEIIESPINMAAIRAPSGASGGMGMRQVDPVA